MQDGGHQTGNTYISASRADITEIPTATPKLLRRSNQMRLGQILSDQIGCGESIVAASKPQTPVSQLPGEIEAKFQQLNL